MLTYDQRKSKAKEFAAKWVQRSKPFELSEHAEGMFAVGMETGFEAGAIWAEDIYIREIYRLMAELEATKQSKKRK